MAVVENTTARINLWSGPRNVSTAFMYSFAQRADTTVVDEPLYGHYLRVADAVHPGMDEVMADMECDGERVVRESILGPCPTPVLFLKQMAHHLVDLDRGFLAQTVNVLLIRDPVQMLPSLAQNLPLPNLRDTGLAIQWELYQQLLALGQQPPVIDSQALLRNPAGVLQRLCDQLGIPFDEQMLQWPAGPRPEDGVWAKYWYKSVHQSTGFEPYQSKTTPFPPRLLPLLAECRPYYEALAAVALSAD
jgi:hypothetical protein